MTPKEKANELVDVFREHVSYWDYRNDEPLDVNHAKQCALICVDRILEFAYDVEWEKKEEAVSKLKFLKEVKKEINKL